MRVLVTGGNHGIGFALCQQLALEHDCHVLLTARSPQKGLDAVSQIETAIRSRAGCKGAVQFLKLDSSDERSVASAAAAFAEIVGNEKSKGMLGKQRTLGAIVNNAGIYNGDKCSVLNTNLYGPKRVCDHFASSLETNGRIVNVGSGYGPYYVGSDESESVQGQSKDTTDRAFLCSGPSGNSNVTWEAINRYASSDSGSDPFGLSKALLACYTGLLARQYPDLLVSCCTPDEGTSKPPEEATVSIRRCLFETLEHGSGWYYGSDGLRSPYHFVRNPGEPEYDGVNPYL